MAYPSNIDTNVYSTIAGRCVPAASVDVSRIDGLTTASLAQTKPSDIDDIYTQGAGNAVWRIIGNLLEADFRGVACQAKINGFANWVKGTSRVIDAKRMTVAKLKTNMYRVQPFILMEVKNPINNFYWSFTQGGLLKSGATTSNITGETATATEQAAYAAGVTAGFAAELIYGGIVAAQNGIPNDIRWFGPGTVVTVGGKSGGGSAIVASFKVISAEILDSDDLVIYMANIGLNDDDPIAALASGAKRGNPLTGVLTRGLPNVTRGESYCDNIPGLNMKQFKPFWIQETRRSFKEDSEYLAFAAEIRKNNPLFRQFGDVESVEWYKQVQEDYDNRLAETFLHNPRLVNQTQEKYASLENVAFYAGDVTNASGSRSSLFAWSGRYHMFRANAEGLLEHLASCTDPNTGRNRLMDMVGAKLDLQTMAEDFYRILRLRKSNGSNSNKLELLVHSRFREKLAEAYAAKFAAKAGNPAFFRQDLKTGSNSLGFTWTTINLDFPSCELALVSHQWLDDRLDAYKKANTVAGGTDADNFHFAGNLALCIDWETTYRALLDSGTAVRMTGDAGEIAKVDASLLCGPLTNTTQTVKHYWEIFTQVVECPLSSIVYQNFDDSEVLVEPEE